MKIQGFKYISEAIREGHRMGFRAVDVITLPNGRFLFRGRPHRLPSGKVWQIFNGPSGNSYVDEDLRAAGVKV